MQSTSTPRPAPGCRTRVASRRPDTSTARAADPAAARPMLRGLSSGLTRSLKNRTIRCWCCGSQLSGALPRLGGRAQSSRPSLCSTSSRGIGLQVLLQPGDGGVVVLGDLRDARGSPRGPPPSWCGGPSWPCWPGACRSPPGVGWRASCSYAQYTVYIRERRTRSARPPRGRGHRVAEQHGDGHRADAARHRRDRARRARPRPRTRRRRRACPSAARFMPTSMTVAPGLIQSPRIISALADGRHHHVGARRTTPARSRVFEWHDGHRGVRRRAAAPPSACRRCCCGRRPRRRAPASGVPRLGRAAASRRRRARRRSAARPSRRRPTFSGWKPSTSFAGAIASSTACERRWPRAAAAAPGCRPRRDRR